MRRGEEKSTNKRLTTCKSELQLLNDVLGHCGSRKRRQLYTIFCVTQALLQSRKIHSLSQPEPPKSALMI